MSDYRRLYLPGSTYFFTLVTYGRRPIFADERLVELLRQAFQTVKSKRPFDLQSAVILPDHLHCLWRLPDGDSDFSTRWQMIKTAFSRRVPAKVRRNGAKTIWQSRFFEHCIRDEDDFHKHLDYIHYNPVKHGLSASPAAWPYSSFWRFVAAGWYAADWGENLAADFVDMDRE
ncbi:MAG: transposase [Methylococcaceae bacterium]|nr:transposase [Methylococcaceae bacterium]